MTKKIWQGCHFLCTISTAFSWATTFPSCRRIIDFVKRTPDIVHLVRELLGLPELKYIYVLKYSLSKANSVLFQPKTPSWCSTRFFASQKNQRWEPNWVCRVVRQVQLGFCSTRFFLYKKPELVFNSVSPTLFFASPKKTELMFIFEGSSNLYYALVIF